MNNTTTWNEKDKEALATAKRRCGEIYPGYPCLTKFFKREEQTYWAACGQKR